MFHMQAWGGVVVSNPFLFTFRFLQLPLTIVYMEVSMILVLEIVLASYFLYEFKLLFFVVLLFV